jgi:hypothetical protein
MTSRRQAAVTAFDTRRVDLTILVRDADASRAIVDDLEEEVSDDPSSDEDITRLVADREFDGRVLPPGVMCVSLVYDGVNRRSAIRQLWYQLLDHDMSQAFYDRILLQPSGVPTAVDLEARDAGTTRAIRRQQNGLVTRRMREAATRRAETRLQPPEMYMPFQYNWDDTLVWQTEQRNYPIAGMDDPMLWQTVIWLVRNQVQLFEESNNSAPNVPSALQAARWLQGRPVFRALLKESIRRCFTFPDDVFNYCKAYVLDRQYTVDGYLPWQDPSRSIQPQMLGPILTLPDTDNVALFHKDLRSIEL